jgi:hypothetical protein
MARVQFAKGTKRAKDCLYSACACHQNILGAPRYPGEQNLTPVAFSKKSLARFVPLAPLAALKYAQTGQSLTFNASTGRAIRKIQKNRMF